LLLLMWFCTPLCCWERTNEDKGDEMGKAYSTFVVLFPGFLLRCYFVASTDVVLYPLCFWERTNEDKEDEMGRAYSTNGGRRGMHIGY
jgi:hypothetical protein